MSDFVTKAGAPAPADEPVVPIDAFWPAIDPKKLRDAQRVPEQVTAPKLREAIIAALITALNDLAPWGSVQQAAGYAALADVPAIAATPAPDPACDPWPWQNDPWCRRSPAPIAAPVVSIDGKTPRVLSWYRAIGCYTKAELIERNRDLDITNAGDRKADILDPAKCELRRDALHAVRDILGRTRTTVELI